MPQGATLLDPSRLLRGLSPRAFRIAMHVFPPIRNTGVKVEHISDDWRHWKMRLPLSAKTRNYVGTHFGGTLYSAADPHIMLAWMHILGDEYVVWDKSASIRFRRPGTGTLRAEFAIPETDVDDVRQRLGSERKVEKTYHLAWVDAQGRSVAEVEKVLHFQQAS